MAGQLLYSCWLENEEENTLLAHSEDVTEKDVAYLLNAVDLSSMKVPYPDEENADAANTYFLRLPSGRVAVARAGLYSSGNLQQSGNRILHAFIAKEEETIEPILYGINNCFKTALTSREQNFYRISAHLSEAPFPRSQFKLSQQEIRKFFSAGRLRTLSLLLQAIIDSAGNERKIFLNDRYSALKYWFYGIHCCLPSVITQKLTYTTYSQTENEACKLICTAPKSDIDFRAEIETGHFVFDHIHEISSDDVESARYARSIVRDFHEDAQKACMISERIETIMTANGLSVPTAAGIYKLAEREFEWFDSTYDIHFFLSKLSPIDRELLLSVTGDLWQALMREDSKFKLDEPMLPLLAYMYKNTDETTKSAIVCYIDEHREAFGAREALSPNAYLCQIRDKMGFVLDYAAEYLCLNGLGAVLNNLHARPLIDWCILLYIIVENRELLSEKHGGDAVYEACYRLVRHVLASREESYASDLCHQIKTLWPDALHRILIQPALDLMNEDGAVSRPDEAYVFALIEALIDRPEAVADLVKSLVRNERFSDSVIDLYLSLCRTYPEEIAQIEEILSHKPHYTAFLTEVGIRKFLLLEGATQENLTFFFDAYYLQGKDRRQVFLAKLKTYLQTLFPVRQIETAVFFLLRLQTAKKPLIEDSLLSFLCQRVIQQSPSDLFDYFHADADNYLLVRNILLRTTPAFSAAFEAAGFAIELHLALRQGGADFYRPTLKKMQTDALCNCLLMAVSGEGDSEEFAGNLMRHLLRFLLHVAEKESDYREILFGVLSRLLVDPVYSRKMAEYAFRDKYVDPQQELPILLAPLFSSYLVLTGHNAAPDTLCRDKGERFLLAIPRSLRKDYFRQVLGHTAPSYQGVMRTYLTDLYCENLPMLYRPSKRKREKLFTV